MRRLLRLMIAVAVVSALSGCVALPVVAGAVIAGSGNQPQSSLPPIQHYSDGSTSERGNIPKVVGEKAGFLDSTGQIRLATFTVTRIVTDPSCLNANPRAPQNGHYLEVDLRVDTTAELGTEGGATTLSFQPDT